jgi:hypothetical protein
MCALRAEVEAAVAYISVVAAVVAVARGDRASSSVSRP